MPALRVVLLGSLLGCGAAPRAALVTPALIEWSIGVDQPEGPSTLVETILPARYQGTPVWRVVHRDADPAASGAINDYDLYDVERGSAKPLRSLMNREGFSLGLIFQGDTVHIDRRTGDDRQQRAVTVHAPMPEGPGETVLLGTLPLAVGYRTSFAIVDRWAEDPSTPVKQVDLAVVQADRLHTALGTCDVLEVTLTPRDGSFRIRDWVRASPPRYPVRTEYVRGTLTLISEVSRMVLADGGPACADP